MPDMTAGLSTLAISTARPHDGDTDLIIAGCKNGSIPPTAPKPVTAAAGGPKIVEKGKLSDAVVVDVLIKKYLSHLPLYRQAADLQRDCEIELSRSTLNAAVMT